MTNSFNSSHDTASKQEYFSTRFKTILEKKGGTLTFSEFMAYSLYDEQDGYYSSPDRKRVGSGGDFITSVSVGKTFTTLIIERLKKLLNELQVSSFSFIELGPESGDFAEDFLSMWSESDGHLKNYYAIERAPLKAQAIEERLFKYSTLKVTSNLPQEDEFCILFANEVLDAFPVHLIEKQRNGWGEVSVMIKDGTLTETITTPQDPDLKNRINELPKELPLGYRTELCLGYKDFFKDISHQLTKSHLLFFDYYLSEEEYFSPHRTEGTLQTYYKHSKKTSPYASVGNVDLSCHVNFNQVKKAAEQTGFTVSAPVNQGQFLTTHARSWLLTLSPSSPHFQKTINEFKTLTMPELFGAKFQVVEMSL